MDRVKGESFRFDCPLFADELEGRGALEGLEAPPEVVGADDVGEVSAQLVVVIVVEAFDGRVLDRAVPLPGSGLAANRERGSARCGRGKAQWRSDCVRQRGGSHLPGLLVQLDVSEFRGAVEPDEKIQFAFRRLKHSNINVEVAERVGFELLLDGRVTPDLGQSAEDVALQTALQR